MFPFSKALAAARGGAGAEDGRGTLHSDCTRCCACVRRTPACDQDTLLKFEALKNFNAKVQEAQHRFSAARVPCISCKSRFRSSLSRLTTCRTRQGLGRLGLHGFRCAGTKPEAAQAAKDATKQAVEGRDRWESEHGIPQIPPSQAEVPRCQVRRLPKRQSPHRQRQSQETCASWVLLKKVVEQGEPTCNFMQSVQHLCFARA